MSKKSVYWLDEEYYLYELEECDSDEYFATLEIDEDFLQKYRDIKKECLEMQNQISRMICKQHPQECPIVNYKPEDE